MGYGGEWFWDNLQTSVGIEWVADAMKGGTLTCVTDGSYIRHIALNCSGAGWII